MFTKGPFTAGPWKYEVIGGAGFRAPEPGDYVILAANGLAPAIVWGTEGTYLHNELKANAALIAASPALFEALEDAIDCIPLDMEHLPVLTKAKAALRAARGGA